MKKNLLPFLMLFAFAACNDKPKTETEKTETTEVAKSETVTPAPNPDVTNWMSWETGMDVAAVTDASLKMPNVIFHIAKMVNTPVGSAPSGMVLYQPDSTQPPLVIGFVSTNKAVGDYFGPKIFAGTPFEKAPTVMATFDIKYDGTTATAKVVAGGHSFECTMSELGNPYLIYRSPSAMPPFYQQGVERTVGKTVFKVDGKEIKMMIPPVGITGGPGAVVSPNGVYAR